MTCHGLSDLPKKKEKIIFDFDGTLFSLDIPWEQGRQELMKKLQKIDHKLADTYVEDMPGLMNRFSIKYGVSFKTKVDNWTWEFEGKHLSKYSINSLVTNFIKNSFYNFKFYIWSSNNAKTIATVLEKENMMSFFEKIISADSVLLLKPEIDGFNLIKTSNLPLDKYLMVGDSKYDQKAALNSSIDYLHIDEFGDIIA